MKNGNNMEQTDDKITYCVKVDIDDLDIIYNT